MRLLFCALQLRQTLETGRLRTDCGRDNFLPYGSVSKADGAVQGLADKGRSNRLSTVSAVPTPT